MIPGHQILIKLLYEDFLPLQRHFVFFIENGAVNHRIFADLQL